jgi:hypothetical protein
MKQKIITVILIMVCIQNTIAQNPTGCSTDEKSLERAKLILEQTVVAYGGKERIRKVESVLSYDKKLDFVNLDVFPGKSWTWLNQGRPFGLSVRTFDRSNNSGFIVNKGDKAPFFYYTSKVIKPTFEDLLGFFSTKGWEEKVLGVGTTKIKNQEYDVVCKEVIEYIENGKIKTRLNDFIYDRETHLLFRKLSYSNKGTVGGILFTTDYSNYVEVNGIKFAQREVITDFDGRIIGNNTFTVEVNVDFRKDLFDNPPSIKDGPNGWKVKKL